MMKAIDWPAVFKPDPVRPPIGHGDQDDIYSDGYGTLAGPRQGSKAAQQPAATRKNCISHSGTPAFR